MNIPPRAATREEFVDQLFAWLDEHGRTHFEENVHPTRSCFAIRPSRSD